MKKYIVEFIGTFFFVLIIVCAVNSAAVGMFAPIAIGSALMVMIYAGGHISGGHFNPAVTLAVFMRGKCDASDVPGYMGAQLLGAAAAAAISAFVLGKAPDAAAIDLGAVGSNTTVVRGLVAELLGTFALAWVVLQTATTKSNEGNSFYGLAIGFTVTASAYALGGFGTGGCFNPAVALGALVDGLSTGMTFGVTIVANLLGGALAAVMFKMTYGSND